MSNRSASSKRRSSRLPEACTIRSLAPAGIATPPTSVSAVASRRQATTEPAWRKHSSAALGISEGSAQISSQASPSVRRSLIAFAAACAVVSCAATMIAIIIECR